MKCLLASLAPPFDRWLVESGLREVMRQHLWLGCGDGRKLVALYAHDLGDATVQNGPSAPEQILVSRFLDQRVLEAIIGFWRQALHQQDVGLGKPFRALSAAARPRSRLARASGYRRSASDHGADLRDLARPGQAGRVSP